MTSPKSLARLDPFWHEEISLFPLFLLKGVKLTYKETMRLSLKINLTVTPIAFPAVYKLVTLLLLGPHDVFVFAFLQILTFSFLSLYVFTLCYIPWLYQN